MAKYLIGVGAAKCGTTLLYDLLESHPELSKAREKELHYFDRTDAPDRAAYEALFRGDMTRLEVTPNYMFYQDSIKKICDALGAQNVRIVVLLRDPIERARSHYYMRKEEGLETLSFQASFEQEPHRIAQNERELRLFSYFARGRYMEQMANIYRYVPRENVRIYIFEDFVKNQQEYIDDICDFAGISRINVRDKHSNRGVVNVKYKWLNDGIRLLSRKTPRALKLKFLRKIKHALTRVNEKNTGKRPLDPVFKRQLVRYYQSDVSKLRETFGLDLSSWPNF